MIRDRFLIVGINLLQLLIALLMWILPDNPGKWHPPAVALAVAPILVTAVLLIRWSVSPGRGLDAALTKLARVVLWANGLLAIAFVLASLANFRGFTMNPIIGLLIAAVVGVVTGVQRIAVEEGW